MTITSRGTHIAVVTAFALWCAETVVADGTATFDQVAYIKASNPGSGDGFGRSVALYGNTLAVGAWGEDSSEKGINGNSADDSAEGSGAVYIFERDGSEWRQQAYVKASDTEAGDLFGRSVALYGDTLAVGADRADEGAGTVYVFTRKGTTWSQQARLKGSNTEGATGGSGPWEGDNFGLSVAVYGDTLAVGADDESSGATGLNGDPRNNSALSSGAVYVFVRRGSVWTQQAYIKASNTGAGDSFGRSVALHGNTLAVGANQERSNAYGVNGNGADDSAAGAGAAYVFARSGNTWSQQAYLKASNTDAGDSFGRHLALYGDTLAVGANAESSGATGIDGDETDNDAAASGAVYVFTRGEDQWTQQAYIKASNTDPGDFFGLSVALAEKTLAVGARSEASAATGISGGQADNNAPDSGAVYVFTLDEDEWNQQAYIKASNSETGDFFGLPVALSGAILAVGAGEEDSRATGINGDGAPDSGTVYVFERLPKN